jgi:hypothetical protein
MRAVSRACAALIAVPPITEQHGDGQRDPRLLDPPRRSTI